LLVQTNYNLGCLTFWSQCAPPSQSCQHFSSRYFASNSRSSTYNLVVYHIVLRHVITLNERRLVWYIIKIALCARKSMCQSWVKGGESIHFASRVVGASFSTCFLSGRLWDTIVFIICASGYGAVLEDVADTLNSQRGACYDGSRAS
jgi:hypothetical protein